MTFPDDDVMRALGALIDATDIGPNDAGEVVVEYATAEHWSGRAEMVLTVEAQEELERRGWLLVTAADADGEAAVTATTDGRAAHRVWLEGREGQRRRPASAGAVRRQMFGRKRN